MESDSQTDYGSPIIWTTELEDQALAIERAFEAERRNAEQLAIQNAIPHNATADEDDATSNHSDLPSSNGVDDCAGEAMDTDALAHHNAADLDDDPYGSASDQEHESTCEAEWEPDLNAVLLPPGMEHPKKLREQFVSWLPLAVNGTNALRLMGLTNYGIIVADGGVVDPVPMLHRSIPFVDQTNPPDLPGGRWFFMGRPINKVEIYGRLTGFEFGAGCVFMKLDEEASGRPTHSVIVHHYTNKTVGHMSALYEKISPGAFLKVVGRFERQYRWGEKLTLVTTKTVPEVVPVDTLINMKQFSKTMRLILERIATRWRVWWIVYGLDIAVDKIEWDDDPVDIRGNDSFQAPGQQILTETLEAFRDGQCYIGANALQVVWNARSALRREGMFNANIISLVVNRLLRDGKWFEYWDRQERIMWRHIDWTS